MYGYEMTYGYDPATEGLDWFKDMFAKVWEKIQKFGQWIKEKMTQLGLWIKRATGTTSKEQVLQDSSDALKDIDEIGNKIADIIDSCSDSIDRLYAAWRSVGAHEKVTENDKSDTITKLAGVANANTAKNSNGNSVNRRVAAFDRNTTTYNDYSKALMASGGMDRLDKDAKNDSKKMTAWNNAKEDLGKIFAKQAGEATTVSEKLKKLASYGPLSLSATKKGYEDLKNIFNANGNFGNGWKKIKIAANWASGDIKSMLSKVVSMYDVGVRATQAFGNRLSSGKVRTDTGEKMDKTALKGIKTEYAGSNKIEKHNKSRYDISTNNKDKNFFDAMQGNASTEAVTVLDRLYQMAYEDAMEDINKRMDAMEAYNSVPEYVFETEAYDDLTYDPDYDLV